MLTDKIRELNATKAKVAELEQAITEERRGELAALPARYGFGSVESFISAVTAAIGGKRGRRRGANAKAAVGKRRKRAKITDAMRAEVKTMVAAGKTGKEIARALGISLPSVANIKKAGGMIKKK